MKIIDFLSQLSMTVPIPILGLLIAIVCLLLAMVGYAAAWLLILIVAIIPGTDFLFVDMEQKLARSIQKWLTTPSPDRTGLSLSSHPDYRNRQLQSQLLTLLRGDMATGKRLLKQQRQLNPGMSDNWYLEKVIYDLERDRH